jgi:hypothetical protein
MALYYIYTTDRYQGGNHCSQGSGFVLASLNGYWCCGLLLESFRR